MSQVLLGPIPGIWRRGLGTASTYLTRKTNANNPTAFYDCMTGFMDEGKAVGVIDFSKAFDMLFHNIPVPEFGCLSLDK